MSHIFDIPALRTSIRCMSAIYELGQALRSRRTEMGLTQERLAALSGLSRQTISQLETGSVSDLGFMKVEKVASLLGLALRVDSGATKLKRPGKHLMTPLERASVSASVSYKTSISAAELKKILVTGGVPKHHWSHVGAFLDEAPVSLLAAVAEQLHDESGIGRDEVWANYRSLAATVKSYRDIWQ